MALLHHPVVDRFGAVFTTMLTSLDMHDLARAGRTYGVTALFVVHPASSQRMLAERIAKHWVEGGGRARIPDRADALELVRVVPDLASVKRELGEHELWSTAARGAGELTSFAQARRELAGDGPPVLIVFGTGWGLAPELLCAADRRLEPIAGRTGYNHLSVRAAAAIVLDRLLS
jgi:hypothetical protein